jgi:hypothetical protein
MRVVLQTPEDTIVREYSVFAGGWTEQTKPRLEFCELLTGPSMVGRTRPLFGAQALKLMQELYRCDREQFLASVAEVQVDYFCFSIEKQIRFVALFILFSGVFVAQV